MAAEVWLSQDYPMLSPAMIAAGRTLAGRVREHIAVIAAFWLYMDDRGRWRLMIATPSVGKNGKVATYRQIQIALEEHPGRRPYGMNDLELDDVTVVDENDELVHLWRMVYPDGVRTGEARTSGVSIAGHYFTGAYFYWLDPAPAPTMRAR